MGRNGLGLCLRTATTMNPTPGVRRPSGNGAHVPKHYNVGPMTSFVESCVGTVADSAEAAEKRAKGRPRAAKLLKILADKKNILITTHLHPDPDALASASGLAYLLEQKLKNAKVSISIKGKVGGGINEVFVKHANVTLLPWDDEA